MNRSSRYRLKLSRRDQKKTRLVKWLTIAAVIVAVGLIVWLAWIRPLQKGSDIHSFAECVAAGNPVQESYPEVCLTKDGKRFVNPEQEAAHRQALDGQQEIVPPSNPALLKLDIDEWDVRIPLTMKTFDLTYTYIENGGEEYLLFTYKRLIQMSACQGDIGLRLDRRFVKHEPPYSENRPPPLANVGKAYFYAVYSSKKCYDDKNADQVALVKKIAGDQTLPKATTALISKIKILPKE